ncbi:alginate lyase family protein [Pontibacter ramchanderi]|uniref:Alginate lyase n=1 Tax=Pontibacter ramchanderi TaxID=1179743 RepID=A0A2N3U790_9BACT|nr:alginate lyase family protein [Pontibacter ramchanderi]PKV62613.1 alginate lyase [Pontibacter ramchanderi]
MSFTKLLHKITLILVLEIVLVANICADTTPLTFILDRELLKRNKYEIRTGNEIYLTALSDLVLAADNVLNNPPYTVVNKTIIPPSGNKHDYFSLAPYWWPDPTKRNGRPYKQKDGRTNPEANVIKDKFYVASLSKDIQLLGLTYYYTEDEKYARKATELLRVFFIDRATRMNPNLNYGQAILGVNDGRSVALIETQHFVNLIDGVQLVAGSDSWTPKDHEALTNWFSQFYKWMLNSSIGKEGIKSDNNIGTYYDIQIITYALFTENKSFAKSYLINNVMKRIDVQFDKDGSQPLELKRTKSWTYCIKNIRGWMMLANLGAVTGVDIWNYRTSSGKSLEQGILWLLPYAAGDKKWDYEEIRSVNLDWFIPIARTSLPVYKNVRLASYLSHKTLTSRSKKELLM